MITTVRKLDKEPEIPYDIFAPKERIVFVDIETTGLRAGRSMIYLIGAAGYEEGTWRLHQFFAESKSEEIGLITEFSGYLQAKRSGQDHLIIVTYNGDSFDLPFLREVEKQYGKSGMMKDTVSFDLYKAVKPYKKLFGLPDLKLVTLERFCGICREDPYGGGELIRVYEEYLRLDHIVRNGCEENEPEKALKEKYLSCLLLHNGEDISDMLPVMRMLSYRYLFESMYEPESAEVIRVCGKDVLDLRFRLRCPLPKELYFEEGSAVISVSGKDPGLLEITVPLIEDDLKLYFEDYRNYFYLPEEDMAIHRSIGEFVDRKSRIRATKETCYIREHGRFLEVPPDFEEDPNIFRRTLKGSCYIRYQKELLKDKAKLKSLSAKILNRFLAFPMN